MRAISLALVALASCFAEPSDVDDACPSFVDEAEECMTAADRSTTHECLEIREQSAKAQRLVDCIERTCYEFGMQGALSCTDGSVTADEVEGECLQDMFVPFETYTACVIARPDLEACDTERSACFDT